MKNDRHITISQLADAPAPTGLRAAVLAQIFTLRRRAALMRAGGLAVIAVASATLLWEAFLYVLEEATASGFVEYVRLLATDSDVTLSLWREFGVAVLSSAPLIPVALVCAVAILLMWSAERLYQNVRVATMRKSFA